LSERTGLPTYVLPWVDDLFVPSEDGLALHRRQPSPDAPEIAVIIYPHVSNHDDVEPLAAAGARLRYVRQPDDLEHPELIVLPGSKTTLANLAWLRQRHLDDRIRALALSGTPVLGICGGLQMLGQELRDFDWRRREHRHSLRTWPAADPNRVRWGQAYCARPRLCDDAGVHERRARPHVRCVRDPRRPHIRADYQAIGTDRAVEDGVVGTGGDELCPQSSEQAK
jgi:putative intracellular protease/amidase